MKDESERGVVHLSDRTLDILRRHVAMQSLRGVQMTVAQALEDVIERAVREGEGRGV